MKFLSLILFEFLLFYTRTICGFRLEDLLPIKYDVVKVRNEREMRLYGHRHVVLDFIGLVEKYEGYTAEEYKLTTRDGYILVLHRITGSPLNPKVSGKPVVFLQHGLFLSSDTFVLIGPGKDLAFLLADAGYDVWLGNARGNTYSRSHVFLSPKDQRFWKFSYHEIGVIDMATSIDYVLEMTGQQRLIYVGYSMGTTEGFALLTTRPEYNKKISLFICLAPIVYWKHKLPATMQMFVNNVEAIQNFVQKYKYYEVLPQSTFLGKVGRTFCSDKTRNIQLMMCSSFVNFITPIADVQRLNTSAYPAILSYFPAGTSFQSLMHYIQNIITGEFQAYDYGPKLNYIKYSSKTPPVYNLKRVTVPVAVYYGNNDYFVTPKDNYILRKKLPNVVFYKKIPNDNFNHMDILWAKDVKWLLYDSVISLIAKYAY